AGSRPWISKSPSNTRSPCGPHANGPGSLVVNRHVRRWVDGFIAHARPSATKATVWAVRGAPVHPAGSGWPFASVATGSGLVVVGTGVLDVDVDVHAVAAQSAAMLRIARRRMVPSRRYTIEPKRSRRSQRLQRGHDLFGDVEVRIDGLDVVEVLEGLDQPEHLRRLAAVDRDRALRQHRELGRGDRHPRLLERPLH